MTKFSPARGGNRLVKSWSNRVSLLSLSSSVGAMITTKGGGWFAGFVGVLLVFSLPCTSPVQVGAQELGSRASCGKSLACPEEWNRGACCHGGSRRRHRQSGCVGRAAASVDSCGGGLGRRLRGGSGGRDSELGLRGQKAGRQDDYLKSGFISVCEARFEARTAGSYLAIEDDGKVVRNVEYGASCARTAMPMKAGDGPLVHYVELELKGGGAPFKDFKGLEFNGTWMPYTQQGAEDGTIGCTVGIMASLGPDDEPLNMVDTTLPDDSFVWCRRGKATWWFGELGVSALSKLACSDFKESLEIHSGDRIGVLVDLHASRLGFLRNGTIVRELTRDLSSVLPTYELHFVVGGQRPNTTWTMVPPAQAWQSLKSMDWDAWRDTPSCESVNSQEPLPSSPPISSPLLHHSSVSNLIPPVQCITCPNLCEESSPLPAHDEEASDLI